MKPLILTALAVAGCAGYEAYKNREEEKSSPADDADGTTGGTPDVTDTSENTEGVDDTGSTSEAEPPLQKTSLTVDGEVVSTFPCYDEYVEDDKPQWACYVSQFQGSYGFPPRTEFHRVEGSVAEGLTDHLIAALPYGPDQANVNGGEAGWLDDEPYYFLPYNSVSSATVTTTDQYASGDDSFNAEGQTGEDNGVWIYHAQGELVGTINLSDFSLEGHPLTGPVNPKTLGNVLYVGVNNYGNGSTEYEGDYGMHYGKSALAIFNDPLNQPTQATLRVLQDDEGHYYYEFRSMEWSESLGSLILSAVDGETRQAVVLGYNPSDDSLVKLTEVGSKDAGFLSRQDESGNIYFAGAPNSYVMLSPDGGLRDTPLTGINSTFVASVTSFDTPDGSRLVSDQYEIDSSTVGAELLWIGAGGYLTQLASDDSARFVLPHFELGAGAYGQGGVMAIGGFSGSDRSDDSTQYPWKSEIHFLY